MDDEGASNFRGYEVLADVSKGFVTDFQKSLCLWKMENKHLHIYWEENNEMKNHMNRRFESSGLKSANINITTY